jgi:small subunit ribosomal protein S6|uniref:Small ribosomal subunit protein bS6c n=1 Tax=Corallina chilensis TaxID=2582857 RepID=A0A4P8VVF3_9FLOR|nr:30S ribosomal protein S6 [Corallina chilensis]QCS25465.1 30S ribosomal protein S6 [Corallina chilensis]
MNLNQYEIIYILKPDVTEAVNLELVHYYKSLLKKNGGQSIVVQHRGRRHLSYNILQYYDGIYVQVNYESNGHLVGIIEKSMRLNENVLRYLTIKKS